MLKWENFKCHVRCEDDDHTVVRMKNSWHFFDFSPRLSSQSIPSVPFLFPIPSTTGAVVTWAKSRRNSEFVSPFRSSLSDHSDHSDRSDSTRNEEIILHHLFSFCRNNKILPLNETSDDEELVLEFEELRHEVEK